MPQLQVKKVVAVCFLEAAKLTLEHLGALRLELSQMGAPGPADLPRLYGDTRRLRDYLQRCVSGHQDQVELDLADADAGLLVASCRRSVEVIDRRLIEQAVPPDERSWLQKKLEVVGDWAVELAAKPLMELPLRRLSATSSEQVRALTTRLQNKVFGDVRERAKVLPPSTTNSMVQGVPTFGEEVQAMSPRGTGEFDGVFTNHTGQLPRPVAPAPIAAAPTERQIEPQLFDHVKLCDPRLRSLASVDLRSYERALAANDYRLATVLMASVLEAAVLDHVIPRRTEFGLSGTPDTWNPQELLMTALGEQATPKDRSLVYHLFAARNLLRPATQIVTPSVVTVSSFERLREFVQRALHGIGFGSVSHTLPPGSMRAADFGSSAGPGI